MKLKNIFQITAMLLAVSMAGCTKDGAAPVESTMDTSSDLLNLKADDARNSNSTSNKFTDPADGEKDVLLDKVITVNFNDKISPAQIAKSTFTLTAAPKQDANDDDDDDDDDGDDDRDDSKSSSDNNNNSSGSRSVAGTLTFTNSTAVFTPTAKLIANTVYTASITTRSYSKDGNSRAKNSYKWRFTTGAGVNASIPSVTSSDPLNNATGVVFNKAIAVTFSGAMDPLTINASTFTLNQGSTVVAGTVTYAGTIATFKPTASLTPNQVYTATITTGAKNLTGIALLSNYTFSFTSASALDVTAPTVTLSDPLNNATGVATSKVLSVTFSESMTASTISASTITLKQGTTTVAGTVSYSGTKATFTPSSALAAGTTYTVAITTGVKDLIGNALAANYSFSFTTAAAADVTAPTVSSTSPLNNATSVALNKAVTVTFSEAMTSSTINTSTFTLKQGTTTVAGSVTYSGTTATYTPSASLTASTVYTATITTGAKDVAGNALAANTSVSFTTAAPVVTGLSFATDVVPVLAMCQNCHNHNWTSSTNASTYYTNLVNSNYVNVASYTSSKIYSGINNGHYSTGSLSKANSDKIIIWMTQGSKNN